MRESKIAAMAEAERVYWWHVSCRLVWRSVLRRFLPGDRDRQIIDVGCGGGINLRLLREFGKVEGVDISPTAVDFAKDYGPARLGDALALPYADSSQGLITAFDLLEHLADDAAVVREWHRVLKPGGFLLISSPAYQWLYGPRDRAFMHQRRYSRPGFRQLVEANGFRTVFSSYFFMFTFPLFVLQRLVGKLVNQPTDYTPAPRLVNRLLIMVSWLEAQWLRAWPLPFGSSVLILAQKK